MDEQTLKLMSDSKILHLKEKFIEENVDMDGLLAATADQIKELVPKLGDRMRLEKFLVLQKKHNKYSESNSSMSDHNIVTTMSTEDTLILEPDLDGTYDLISTAEQSFIDNVASNGSCQEKMTPRQIKLEESSYFMNAATVREYLMQERTGKSILNSYQINGHLTSSDRRRLVHLVVDGLLERHQNINKTMFASITDDICNIFPSENKNVYYMEIDNGKRKITAGKIVDRYRNQRHYFNSRKLKPVPQTHTKPISKSMEEKVSFLQHSTEPWAQVLEYWQDTTEVRRDQRLIEEPAHQFLDKWPALKHSLGFILVSLVFYDMY